MNEPTYGQGDTSFRTAGGEDGVHQLVVGFYDVMATRDYAATILAMHPEDLSISIDKLYRFLCGWLGGPKLYSEKYGGIAIPPAHAHLPVTDDDKEAWLRCMQEAVERQPYPDSFKTYLIEQLAVPAGRIVQLRKNMDRQNSN